MKIAPDQDFMTLVPRALLASELADGTGRTVVLVPRYRDFFFGRLLQPRLPAHKKHIRVTLDARGSLIWQAMDGIRSVGELCGLLAAERPDDAEQLPQRVGLYLYHLAEKRFIEFVK